MYYYIDTLRYFLIYQNIDSNDENDNNMSKENDDSMSNATEIQLKKANIQKSDNNEKFETAAEY